MKLELSTHEAALLKTELGRRIYDLDRDLVRTDKHELQHALARDIDELRGIERRLAGELAGGQVERSS
ncbi:MAG TPA: hypothetical protein VGI39_35950 [Polyangiaceae bacterium]